MRLLAWAALLLAMPAATAGRAGAAEPSRGIGFSLESTQTAFYPGQDLVVKLTFTGAGDNEAVIEPEAFVREAFTLQDAEGRAPKKIGPTTPAGPAPQGALTLRGFDTGERLINLSAWYPGLTAKTGRWDITWSHGSMKSGPVRAAVIKPYRPGKDTTALVATELGTMTWELMPDLAPEHVKHFVDLARTGFYEGLSIFRVIPGIQAEGGDPKGDGTGAWSHLLKPEMSTKVLMGAGLIGAARKETSMTSDSMFFITLGPSDYMLGKQTFYARVTDGWEVVAKLHPLPTKGDTGLSDSYMLIAPVKILQVTIR